MALLPAHPVPGAPTSAEVMATLSDVERLRLLDDPRLEDGLLGEFLDRRERERLMFTGWLIETGRISEAVTGGDS